MIINSELYLKNGSNLDTLYPLLPALNTSLASETGAVSDTESEIVKLRAALLALKNAFVFVGTVNASTPLPSSGYKYGWAYVVEQDGVYAGLTASERDIIVCVSDFNTLARNSDWIRIGTNGSSGGGSGSSLVSTIPTASSANVGTIIQYDGPTITNFTHGYFYECVEDTTTTPFTYRWENIAVQSGTTGYNLATAYKRVSNLSHTPGDVQHLFYLDTNDGTDKIGLYIWDNVNGFTLITTGTGNTNDVLVGMVNSTTPFPTTRGDGTTLQLGDYTRPDPTETYPLTVGGVTFNSPKDVAVYAGGNTWVLNPYNVQETADTPVTSRATESISGLSYYQNDINKEFKDTLTYVWQQTSASTMWDILHNLNRYPSVRCVDYYGNVMLGEVIYVNEMEIRVKFSLPESGKAYLS